MTQNQKKLRELLDRELDALEGGLSDLEGRIRAARASFDADDQVATHAEPDTEAQELADIKRPNSFFSHLVVAAEHRGSATEKGEMTLQGQISVSFFIRFRRLWFRCGV